ncbi:type II secretion system protein [Candidatus Nesciobacter abundans]|uniref:Prepilin-type N-terminal cleavage/methylation domain-containing protein n=1 Tax=Candidatus Nesciobacter abundans TaxID=2601668 RepID=A0A5C0UHH2_9PROT|nr:hypothetical protein [Candidatus Nesciobacter abundans]QEK39131.1 hypothetical protein FZC36_01635 [Candidatus Nesciobacter abundans]
MIQFRMDSNSIYSNISRFKISLSKLSTKLSKYFRPKGFSFFEIGIVIFLISILLGYVIKKGSTIMEKTKMFEVSNKIRDTKMSIESFKISHGFLPGDCPHKNMYKPGNGNNIIEGKGLEKDSESYVFWDHLYMHENTKIPKSHFISVMGGGIITVEQNPDGLEDAWLIIGKPVTSTNRANGPLFSYTNIIELIKNLSDSIDDGELMIKTANEGSAKKPEEISNENKQSSKKIFTAYIRI